MTALRVIVLFALVATAAAADADASTLRGRHPHQHHHHKHAHSASDSAAAPMRFRASTNAAATQLNEAAARATTDETQRATVVPPTTHADNVARVGLGENLPYSGMDYLGTGYDYLLGNPEGDPHTKVDSGFRRPVVNIEWSQDALHNTRDLRDLQPTTGWAMPERSCNQASSADTISSMSDYSEDLSIQASISAEVDSFAASGAFEASAGYNKFSQEVASTESYRFQMTSYCLRFKAGLNKQGQKALPDFMARAAQLDNLKSNGCAGTMVSPHSVNDVEEGLTPSTSTVAGTCAAPPATAAAPANAATASCAEKTTEATCTGTCVWTGPPPLVCEENVQYAKWELFFHDFGTHYIDNLHLGGKMIFQIDMDSGEHSRLDIAKVDVAMEVSAEYGPVSGSLSGEVNTASEAATSFSTSKKTVKTIILGGTPPEDAKTGFGEWAATVDESPMPVKYTFMPFSYLMKPDGSAKALDEATYNHMLGKYKARIMLGHRPTDRLVADRTPHPYIQNGESWKSTNGGAYLDSDRNILKLEHDGRFTITRGDGYLLWDSMFTEVHQMNDRPSTGEYELKLMNNGNLVLQRLEILNSNEEPFVIWQSVTSKNSCEDKLGIKAEFKDGALNVYALGDKLLWTTGTGTGQNAGATEPQRAKAKYFGYGQHQKDGACTPAAASVGGSGCWHNSITADGMGECNLAGCATLYKDEATGNFNPNNILKKIFPYPMKDTQDGVDPNHYPGRYNAAEDLGNNGRYGSVQGLMEPYKVTDSLISKAGIDGAHCMVSGFGSGGQSWSFDLTSTQPSLGGGDANTYGNAAANGYDSITRNTRFISKIKLRDGTEVKSNLKPALDSNWAMSATAQLASDVQTWKCRDETRKRPADEAKTGFATTTGSRGNYKFCKHWEHIAPTFDAFTTRLRDYFEGCTSSMKMAWECEPIVTTTD